MYCTCHICHVYGICRSKEGGCFKVIIWGGNASHKGGGNFNKEWGGGGFQLCNTAALKLYCKSYWVLSKILQDTSFPYVSAVLPVLYLLTLAWPKVQVKVS